MGFYRGIGSGVSTPISEASELKLSIGISSPALKQKMGYTQLMELLVSLMGGGPVFLRVFLKGFCIPGQGSGCFSNTCSSAAEAERVAAGGSS
ncbi:hypothetical protein RHMOL_Rhmol09G0049100 [Rhododendron molle]|uniref:Uncharacterized protein n=1 Tax=Rhododendron molle TaxID=49168 RepID=A0ACC0MA72_RHOML|nr:hypothetical protein RHMOL_Rhmol09G0049100 [Rhododendron molle]